MMIASRITAIARIHGHHQKSWLAAHGCEEAAAAVAGTLVVGEAGVGVDDVGDAAADVESVVEAAPEPELLVVEGADDDDGVVLVTVQSPLSAPELYAPHEYSAAAFESGITLISAPMIRLMIPTLRTFLFILQIYHIGLVFI